MSRKDELLKLAQLFHSQARLTLDRSAKQVLRKLGDRYQNEAKKLQGQVSADCASLTVGEIRNAHSEFDKEAIDAAIAVGHLGGNLTIQFFKEQPYGDRTIIRAA